MSTFIPEDKHRQVLETCIDVPEETPSFPLPLGKVGISGKTVWVSLTHNKGGHIPFNATIMVNLDGNRRGIHMSRMEQAIGLLHDREFSGLPDYGRELAGRILADQKALFVSLKLSGKLPFIQQAPVSRLPSIDSAEVSFAIEIEKKNTGDTIKTEVGAGVHHLTACPCTLSYNEALFERFNDPWPQATHSQRSKTTVWVSPPNDRQLPGYRELLDILAGALHLSQDLLKRPDETELVLKAHRCPQFAEDTVREVAKTAGEKLKDTLPPETCIKVHSKSLESIHIHDVECFLDTTLHDILAAMQSTDKE